MWSGPLFLSSLQCTDNHESLLYDCSHDQLGVASCGDGFGVAMVKCFSEIFYLCTCDITLHL